MIQYNSQDDNFHYDMDYQSTEEGEATEDFEEANYAVKSLIPESHGENEMAIHGDQRVWVKASDALFTDQIKEEISECEYQTIVDVKDEIEEVEIQPTIVGGPIQLPPLPPPATGIQVKKVAVQKLSSKTLKPRVQLGRRPRPILPMTPQIAATSHFEQASTQHRLIIPSTQMTGIAYQIFLGDHGENSNNPVQYTMLQQRPLFLQQTQTPVSNTSPVVISQPYPMTRSQVPTLKISKTAPKTVHQTYCPFCYKYFKNMQDHVKYCWANPANMSNKFKKIAPSPL